MTARSLTDAERLAPVRARMEAAGWPAAALSEQALSTVCVLEHVCGGPIRFEPPRPTPEGPER